MAYDLHRIDAFELIAKRRAEWLRFASRHSSAAPFCGPETWLAWLETFLEFEPVVYELREDGELRALLPLYQHGLTLCAAADTHLDYQDVVAESTEMVVLLLREIIRRERQEGLSLTFAKVAEHSRLFAALQDPRIGEVAAVHSRYWSICPTTRFRISGPGHFLQALSSRKRKDYKSSTRKTEESFPDHVTELRFGREIDLAAIEAAGRLHQSNQYRKEGDSVFSDPNFSDFLERQVREGAPLLMATLRERPGGLPMAFNLGYFADDTYYYYLTAYEGRHAALSPGRRVLIDSLAYCADRVKGGQLRFDLLSGEEGYKGRWATSFYELRRFQVIPKRLGNLPRATVYATIYGLKEAKNQWRSRWGNGDPLTRDLEHESPALPS